MLLDKFKICVCVCLCYLPFLLDISLRGTQSVSLTKKSNKNSHLTYSAVSLVNGSNQKTSLKQLRTGRHHPPTESRKIHLQIHIHLHMHTRRYIHNDTQRRRHTTTGKFNIVNTETHEQTHTQTCFNNETRIHVKNTAGINHQTYQGTREGHVTTEGNKKEPTHQKRERARHCKQLRKWRNSKRESTHYIRKVHNKTGEPQRRHKRQGNKQKAH